MIVKGQTYRFLRASKKHVPKAIRYQCHAYCTWHICFLTAYGML